MPKKKDKDDKDDDQEEEAEGIIDILSDQSVSMLEALSDLGVYGQTPEEVAARFVDERLQELAGPPGFSSD